MKIIPISIALMLMITIMSGCIFDSENNIKNDDKSYLISIDGKGNYFSIQEAIDSAADNDTIFVKNASHIENIVINKPVKLIGEDKNTTIIDGNGSGDVIYISADYVKISGFTITNSGKLYYPEEDAGIDIHSKNSIISENNINFNGNYGLYLGTYSDNNIIINNIVSNNRYGIYSNYASNNNISNNTFSFNSDYGIYFGSHSDKNVIYSNIFSENSYGVRIKGSEENMMMRNLFILNQRGLYFCCGARDNIIYNNIFKNNSMWNAEDGVINKWYFGEIGNFWSDYNGSDMDDDGIGDTPYYISIENNKKDIYPLMMEPFKYEYKN